MESKFPKFKSTERLQQAHVWGFNLLTFYDIWTEMIIRNGKWFLRYVEWQFWHMIPPNIQHIKWTYVVCCQIRMRVQISNFHILLVASRTRHAFICVLKCWLDCHRIVTLSVCCLTEHNKLIGHSTHHSVLSPDPDPQRY